MRLKLTLIIVRFVLKVPPHQKSGQLSRKIEEHLFHLRFIKMVNLDANFKVFFKPFYMNSAVSIAKTAEVDETFVWRIFVYGNEIGKNISARTEIPFMLNNKNYKTFCDFFCDFQFRAV